MEKKSIEYVLPEEIEKRSFEIIAAELAERGITLPAEQDPVTRRVIHTSADFDYAETMTYSERDWCPAFVIGVPVGFVNVEAAKELIMETDVPYIINRGRKGGSNVAAAICNALLYELRKEQENVTPGD